MHFAPTSSSVYNSICTVCFVLGFFCCGKRNGKFNGMKTRFFFISYSARCLGLTCHVAPKYKLALRSICWLRFVACVTVRWALGAMRVYNKCMCWNDGDAFLSLNPVSLFFPTNSTTNARLFIFSLFCLFVVKSNKLFFFFRKFNILSTCSMSTTPPWMGAIANCQIECCRRWLRMSCRVPGIEPSMRDLYISLAFCNGE